MKTWIKNPMAIFADNADGGFVIENDKIIELIASGQKPSVNVDKIIDASDLVVTPGLINTHHHYFQTLTRAFAPSMNKELFGWLTTLYGVWQNLTPEALYTASQTAMAELLLSGCTCSADQHYVFPKGLENSVDIQVEAAKNMGFRAVVGRGSMNLSKKDGGLPPDSVVQDEEVILIDCERVINKYHDSSDGAMIQIALSPCSPFSVTKSLMQKTAVLAQKYNVRTHTHLAETLDEEKFCKEKFGCSPTDYLEQVGWMHSQTWIAHGIHFNDEELARLGKAGISISHCPCSNMILASGVCRTVDAEAVGCNINISVDGSASNDASSMVREMRSAYLLQRLKYSNKVNHKDIIRWATLGGAKALGRTDIGEIKVGKQADIAMFKLDEIQCLGAQDPLAALVVCGVTKADKVMIRGEMKVEDGRLLNFDMERHIKEHKIAQAKLIGN